jgi:PAS domain S-box-containing protein
MTSWDFGLYYQSMKQHSRTNNQPSNTWHQQLLESTSAIPWEMDATDLRFTQIGELVVELLGYPVEQWYTENFWAGHVHPDDKAWVCQFCQNATNSNQDHELEYRFIAADGRVVWLREVVSVAENENGQRMLQGFMFDISDRKQVEESLHALATSSPDDNTDDFFFDCVKSLAQVYGAKFAFIGLLKENQQDVRTLAVWAGDHIADNFEYNLEGTPCKEIMNRSKQLIPTDASQLYADDEMLVQMGIDSYFGAPLLHSEGKTVGLVSVMDTKPMQPSEWTAPILDMFATRIAVELEKRAANQRLRTLNTSLEQRIKQRTTELEAANKELEHFAYSVSHDLRAPLRGISGFSQALAEDYAQQLDEQAHDYLQRVQSGCGRMNDLIEALLGLSRLTRGALNKKNTDISQLAHEAIQQLREQDPDRQISIDIEENMQAHCDPKLMHAAITNLLNNAWKYTARSKAPHISFRRRSDGEGFEISDNGVGFDMQYADNLFKAFQRLHPDDEFKGNGIGLATVARIIHRHGGQVWSEGEPDKGATFGFSL